MQKNKIYKILFCTAQFVKLSNIIDNSFEQTFSTFFAKIENMKFSNNIRVKLI